VPIQKSALQEFEAKLVLQEMEEPLLQRSIEEARRAGYLKSGKIRVALDTTPILGKGAVQDTYNLLGEGIEKLARRLLEVDGADEQTWVEQQGLAGYFGSSLKGEAGIDWDDQKQREQWLTQIVGDARRLLSLAEKVKQEHGEQAEAIEADAALLRRLIAQDVEEKSAGGCQVNDSSVGFVVKRCASHSRIGLRGFLPTSASPIWLRAALSPPRSCIPMFCRRWGFLRPTTNSPP